MPKTSASKPATIQVRVGASMKQTIQQYANARDMSAGEFIRYCIWTYMDTTPIDEAQAMEDELSEARRQLESGTFGPPLKIGEIRHGEQHCHSSAP